METRIDEIGSGIYRLSTFVPDINPPHGFTFNSFLIRADEPLLFHCGLKKMFPLVSTAAARVLPLQDLRWIAFGHFESDECGALNEWLAAAPRAEAMHGMVGCRVSIADMADRPPRVLSNREVVELGGRRVRYLDTPHVPHGWDAGVLFEETTGTLFCGDLFTHYGNGPALTEADIVTPAIAAENVSRFTSLGPTTAPTIRSLADLDPSALAVMHGSSFSGRNTVGALNALADYYEARLHEAMADAQGRATGSLRA